MPSLFMEVEEVMEKTGTKRAKAYSIIKNLNKTYSEKFPYCLTIAGKVNREWFEFCTRGRDSTQENSREWVEKCLKELEIEKQKKEAAHESNSNN
jgi:predicted DNA-binding transcriptional regulator AlpA